MRVGNLVKVKDCPPPIQHPQGAIPCVCAFCCTDSSRIGVVIENVPATANRYPQWKVEFDFGEWDLSYYDMHSGDIEVIA